MKTNATITISRRSKAYDHTETLTSLGSFACWIEERITVNRTARDLDLPDSLVEKAQGLVILWEEIDASNCRITYNGTTYEIMHSMTFRDDSGTFHHMEFLYA